MDEGWMPWLRCGIAHDWMVEFKDLSLPSLPGIEQYSYRNPAGPAVAKAYGLAEKSGFKGMRILIPKKLSTQFLMEAEHAQTSNQFMNQNNPRLSHKQWPQAEFSSRAKCWSARLLRRIPWPRTVARHESKIFDIPWWWLLDEHPPAECIIQHHEWQAEITGNPKKGMEHFSETVRLLKNRPLEQ